MSFSISGIVHFVSVYVFTAMILLGLIVYSWHFHKIPGAKAMIAMQSTKFIWLLTPVMIGYAETMQEKIFYLMIMHLAFTPMPYFWYLMFCGLSSRKSAMLAFIGRLFLAVDVIMILFIATSSWQPWYWSRFVPAGRQLQAFMGPVYLINLINIYLQCFINLCLCVRWVFTSRGFQRKTALWLIGCAVVTTTGTVFNIMHDDIALPVSYIIGALLLTVGYYRLHIYDIIPLAEKTAIQYVFSGVLVLDRDGYVAAINQAGRDALAGFLINIGSALSDLEKIGEAFSLLDEYKVQEAGWTIQGTPRYFHLQAIPLQAHGHRLGRVIVLTDITQSKQDHLQLLEQEKAIALLEERDRLSREIHDNRGQFWSFLRMECKNLSFLSGKGDLDALRDRIAHLSSVVEDGNAEFRETLVGLNVKTSRQNFLAAVRSLLKWYEENCRLAVHLAADIAPDSELADIAELPLLRILQEAMVNIRRHAKASIVSITIRQSRRHFAMQITDDGCGFNMAAGTENGSGLGLSNMRERADEIGAKLTITSDPGKGTQIFIELALEETEVPI